MWISRRDLLIGAAGRMWAQQPTFTAGVDVVTLFATVRDPDGRFVQNLERDDFLLEEDGVPQTIRYFSSETDLPLTIGLLVDTSRSQAHVLQTERRASYTFLDQVLREGTDQAFVAHFDVRVELLGDLTASRKELAAALQRLKIPRVSATLLYDAIRQCSEQQMRRKQGRKAFILLSDGFDYRSNTTIETAIEYAQRADTIIFSIHFADPLRFYGGPFGIAAARSRQKAGRAVMRRLAAETGGAYVEVSKDRPIEMVYRQIEDVLRNHYSIGYTPALPAVDGQYRKIKLATRQPGLAAQTRAGYYGRSFGSVAEIPEGTHRR